MHALALLSQVLKTDIRSFCKKGGALGFCDIYRPPKVLHTVAVMIMITKLAVNEGAKQVHILVD